jgi:hypothetical protein
LGYSKRETHGIRQNWDSSEDSDTKNFKMWCKFSRVKQTPWCQGQPLMEPHAIKWRTWWESGISERLVQISFLSKHASHWHRIEMIFNNKSSWLIDSHVEILSCRNKTNVPIRNCSRFVKIPEHSNAMKGDKMDSGSCSDNWGTCIVLGSPFWRCFVGAVQLPVVWTRSLWKNSAKKCDGDTETPQRRDVLCPVKSMVVVQHGLSVTERTDRRIDNIKTCNIIKHIYM